jgi:metal-sulfur cluster biosynthetic enzyme
MSNANVTDEQAVVIITEADRATARRVIRRHVGALSTMRFTMNPTATECFISRPMTASFRATVHVSPEVLSAAVEAAAQGRAYAAALRGAK